MFFVLGSFGVKCALCQGGGPGFPSWFGLRSALFGLYASFLSFLGAVRDVCQLLSDLAAAQWCCRVMQQSCGSILGFGTVLASFWASGVTWKPPGEPLCPTSAPGPSQVRFLAHFGQLQGSLLEPFLDKFSAQGPLQSPPAAIFDQLRRQGSPSGFNVDLRCPKLAKIIIFWGGRYG